LTADKQIEAVSKKLVELNPGFDGKLKNSNWEPDSTPYIENDAVVGIGLATDHVTDISPVRVWERLKGIVAVGSEPGKGRLTDLSPLKGLSLVGINLQNNELSDLSPLQGMPIGFMNLDGTLVADLSLLKGMKLTGLRIRGTKVANLSALQGIPLYELRISGSPVSDLSPLTGMPLATLDCSVVKVADFSLLKELPLKNLTIAFNPERDTELLRSLKTLETINEKPAAEFWKEVEERSKRPRLAFEKPGFDEWVKEVAAMTAEQQVAAVGKKLVELNPGFDGKVTPKVENGVVTGLLVHSDHMTDISPVRALAELNKLDVKLADLSPLKGMHLTVLSCAGSQVSDLSPLKGMLLKELSCAHTKVSDLRPLRGMPLTYVNCQNTLVLDLSPLKDTPLKMLQMDFKPERDAEVLRSIKTLEDINFKSAEDFWKEVDEKKKKLGFQMPGFDQWMKDVAAMPAEQQLAAVSKKLQEINPVFDGKLTDAFGTAPPKIEDGVVVDLLVHVHDVVMDISPVRALTGLRELGFFAAAGRASKLSDLSPLQGMKIQTLKCTWTQVSDLTPLKDMPLTWLWMAGTQVSDLSPLKGKQIHFMSFDSCPKLIDLSPIKDMELARLTIIDSGVTDLGPLAGTQVPSIELNIGHTKITNLAPLKGKKLTRLLCWETAISDWSVLRDMQLTELGCDFNPDRDTEMLRSIKTLEKINGKPVAEFWKEVEQQKGKKKLGFQMPGFDQWMKEVAGMPAEQQLEAVNKKLVELNPGFDGKVTGPDGKGTPWIQTGAVTALGILTDNVTDISPLRALVGLKRLRAFGSALGKGKLADLSPLKTLQLGFLDCSSNLVTDFSALQGMPIYYLSCIASPVADLSSLKGLPLQEVLLGHTEVTDLSPLQDMPLAKLDIYAATIDDLSPLKGLPLKHLEGVSQLVSDFSPLKDTPIRDLAVVFNPRHNTELFRSIKTLETINGKPTSEYCDAVEAYRAAAKLPRAFETPGFADWIKQTTQLTADEQVPAVSKKLVELNPAFDGKVTPTIENGVVTEFQLVTDNVTDISPIRALVGLKILQCSRSSILVQGGLGDLSPLKGMSLVQLNANQTLADDLSPLKEMKTLRDLSVGAFVTDLSPLQGLPLNGLSVIGNPVSDLSPLKGSPFKYLQLGGTLVTDLSPLQGMPLEDLGCYQTKISDLSPLRGMPLIFLTCHGSKVTDFSLLPELPLKCVRLDSNPEKHIDILRSIKTLEIINDKTAVEFWKEVEKQKSQ
ncbi:MAG: pknB 22, partial [Planctomycetaceae bacterium]|nr:pknB 22 [Planctomycetaceae bacterium]